jgi:hypothetical protein
MFSAPSGPGHGKKVPPTFGKTGGQEVYGYMADEAGNSLPVIRINTARRRRLAERAFCSSPPIRQPPALCCDRFALKLRQLT